MTIIRQKLTQASPPDGGAIRALDLVLPRAAMEVSALDLSVRSVTAERVATSALPAALPEHALILTLCGPEGGKGAAILSPGLTGALVEMQMTGRVAGAGHSRRPTRIDASLCLPMVEAALAGLDAALATETDRVWASGFRVEPHVTDAEGLALALPPGEMRLLTARLALAGGVRDGTILLALPAEGRGAASGGGPGAEPDDAFRDALTENVLEAEAQLNAVLCRMTVPLAAVMHLQVGEVIPLPNTSVEQVQVETATGQPVARARLGQNRGMRALRIGGGEVPAPAT